MDEYNDLEVNLAETAAVDDSQEEIIVLEEYQGAQDNYHVTQDSELQSNVLSITDESIRDSMLEVAEAGGPLSGAVDLVYTSPTAESSDNQAWHELQHYVVLGEGEEDKAKPLCIVEEDGPAELSTTGGSLTDGEEIVTVTLPQQTEADTTHVPEVIAMETVITTQPPVGTQAEILEGSGEIDQDGQFMVYEITSQSHVHTATDPEVLYVQASLKDQKKKIQDRLKKKELRQDPDYRAIERIKSRERMKRRRQDPAYREKEREKDRARREFVRKHDPDQRERERERDRNSKRMNRIMSKDTNFIDVSPFFSSEMSAADVTQFQ